MASELGGQLPLCAIKDCNDTFCTYYSSRFINANRARTRFNNMVWEMNVVRKVRTDLHLERRGVG